LKTFDILFRKKQFPTQEKILPLSSVIPRKQALKLSAEEIHSRVLSAKVSLNCLGAAEGYFEIVAPLCPIREDIAHSLLRIATRPIFYLGVTSYEGILSTIKDINFGRLGFLKWLSRNNEMVADIVKELTICCFFYDLEYDKGKNAVVLNHKVDKLMESVFVEISDRDVYKEFLSFSDFKLFFYCFFKEFGISDCEIGRLILEESYEDSYFSG